MTHNTQLPSVFCVIVLRSDGTSVVLNDTARLSAGISGPSTWIELSPQLPIRAGYTEIDDYIAQQELDPQRRALLERARKEIAQEIYGSKPETSLRALRLAHGWSQSSLAKMIGTTQSHIARIESADIDPQTSTLERLGEALGEAPDVILRAFISTKNLARSMNHNG